MLFISTFALVAHSVPLYSFEEDTFHNLPVVRDADCRQCPGTRLCTICKPVDGYSVIVRIVGRQYLPCDSDAVGNEFLDSAYKQDGRRMAVHVHVEQALRL